MVILVKKTSSILNEGNISINFYKNRKQTFDHFHGKLKASDEK